jgi:hypothetical protein
MNYFICLFIATFGFAVVSFSAIAQNQSATDRIKYSVKKVSAGNRYQAIDIDESGNIWISGTNAGVMASFNDGNDWLKINAPGHTEKLQFRDINVENNTITLLAAGAGKMSRIYSYRSDVEITADIAMKLKPEDFKLEIQGASKEHFYNCLTKTSNSYWLFGDSVKSNLFVMQKNATDNATWQQNSLPFSAQEHEGGFASSGTCIISDQSGNVLIGTGNGSSPRLLFKPVQGSWQSIASPFEGGEASGIFSLVWQSNTVYAFGGSLNNKKASASGFSLNLTTRHWTTLPTLPFNGAIYGATALDNEVFVSSPKGVAVLNKNKNNWSIISDNDIWSLACTKKVSSNAANSRKCFGVGADDAVIEFWTIH